MASTGFISPPSSCTGVAAPMVAPGAMAMMSQASEISAPAQMARGSTKATVFALECEQRVADHDGGVDAAAEGVDVEDEDVLLVEPLDLPREERRQAEIDGATDGSRITRGCRGSSGKALGPSAVAAAVRKRTLAPRRTTRRIASTPLKRRARNAAGARKKGRSRSLPRSLPSALAAPAAPAVTSRARP